MIYLIFFYSGKAGKGWRKCWLSTILNTTRLLSLQTGARHALSVKYLWYTFLIFHNLPSSTLPGKVQTWQNQMKRQKSKNDRDKSGCFAHSLDLTNSEQCNHLQLDGPCCYSCYCCYCSGSHSDGSQTCRGLVTVALSLPVLLMASRGAGDFGYFKYFKYFRLCITLTSVV